MADRALLAGIIARMALNYDPRRFETEDEQRAILAAWDEQLRDIRSDDAHAACAAVLASPGQRHFPTIAEFRDVCLVEARARVLRDAETARGITQGALQGMPGWDPEAGLKMVRILREALTIKPPADRSVSSLSAFFAELIAALREEEGLEPVDGPTLTYRCARCLDLGWVTVDDDPARWTIRPCVCQADAYERWRGGHYRRGHTCPECVNARRGIWKRATA